MGLFSYLFASDNKRSLMKIEKIVNQIEDKADVYAKMTDEELQAKTPAFKERLKNGEKMDDILVEAFAVVREAATRVFKTTTFPRAIDWWCCFASRSYCRNAHR